MKRRISFSTVCLKDLRAKEMELQAKENELKRKEQVISGNRVSMVEIQTNLETYSFHVNCIKPLSSSHCNAGA